MFGVLNNTEIETLKQFASSPVGFILGVILNTIVGGIEQVTSSVLYSIQVIFVGEDPTSPAGQKGLADIPVYIGEMIYRLTAPTNNSVYGSVGNAIITTVEIPVSVFLDLARQAGPLEPVVIAAGVSTSAVAIAYVLRFLLVFLADAIPGAEALLP